MKIAPLLLAFMAFFVMSNQLDAGSPYKCYHYSEQDRKHLAVKSEKQVCEGHGYVFSHGNDKMAPGCGGCWCCQPTGGEAQNRWIPLGCYEDHGEGEGRMFNNGYIMMSNDNSPVNCGLKCREGNYTYFGLEFARECWCGNALNFRIPKPSEDCEVCNHENCHTNDLGNKKCPGDPSQGCGNAYRMRLFQWAGIAPSDIEGLSLAEQLLVTGTDVDRRYDDNMTALHIATERDFLEAAKYLIQHGADLEARMRWRFTPLHYAAFKDSPMVAEELIRSGANVNATGNVWTGETILQRAAEEDALRVAQLLIRSGADVNSKDRYGRSPLYETAVYDHIRVARELIQHGADVNARTISSEGWTALHRAAYHNSLRVAKELILSGADRNLVDPKGKKPIDFAKSQEMKELLNDDIED